jgi:hypothetical protein
VQQLLLYYCYYALGLGVTASEGSKGTNIHTHKHTLMKERRSAKKKKKDLGQAAFMIKASSPK